MYKVNWTDVVVAHDQHPHYASTAYAFESPARERVAVQHHRAHIASMLAERGALDTRLIGAVFDGIGYGDDGKIWAASSSLVAYLRVFAVSRLCVRTHWLAAARLFRRRLGSFFDDDEQPDLAHGAIQFSETV